MKKSNEKALEDSQQKVERILSRVRDIEKCVESLRKIERKAMRKFGFNEIRHTKRFNDFLIEPIAYFGKKAGIESNATVDGLKIRLETDNHLQRIVSTSIGAQLRNLYEAWVSIGLLYYIARNIVEPRNLLFSLTLRPITVSKSATVVAEIENGMYLAFFLDTPLPYNNTKRGQEYRSRPDIGIYLLKSMDRVQEHLYLPTSNRLKLLALVECKESTIWPSTKKKILDPYQKSRDKIEVSHLQMLLLYEELYAPPLFFLVSRERTPDRAHEVLSKTGIHVYDEVGFDEKILKKMASQIINAIT